MDVSGFVSMLAIGAVLIYVIGYALVASIDRWRELHPIRQSRRFVIQRDGIIVICVTERYSATVFVCWGAIAPLLKIYALAWIKQEKQNG